MFSDETVRQQRLMWEPDIDNNLLLPSNFEYNGPDSVYIIVGQQQTLDRRRVNTQHYYNTVLHKWFYKEHQATQYDSYAEAEADLWDAENVFCDNHLSKFTRQLVVGIVSTKPRAGDHKNLDMRRKSTLEGFKKNSKLECGEHDMSIYEQLNKINDKESLSEKYNVKNAKELKKLKESCKSRKLLKEEYNEETAIEVVAEYCDAELAQELCDKIWNQGVPVYTEDSQWYADAYVDANNENLLGYVLRDKNITAENIDEIASDVYRAYMSWQTSSSVKKQVEELEQHPDLSNAVAWYCDTHTADNDGWPNEALASDPDFLEAALNWYLDSYYYENDHEDEDDEDEDFEESLKESTVLDNALTEIEKIIDKTPSIKYYAADVAADGIKITFTDGSLLTAIKNLKAAGFKVYNEGREFDGSVRIVKGN